MVAARKRGRPNPPLLRDLLPALQVFPNCSWGESDLHSRSEKSLTLGAPWLAGAVDEPPNPQMRC
jgi:hypothetical protein